MIYWAQLFHFYQPPTQMPPVLEKICQESYRPLLEVFRQNPHIRVTININGLLLEMLKDYGNQGVIDQLRDLGGRGQVEFTGSGKYHPILPLIPKSERKRQIKLHTVASRFFLKNTYKPGGFFPPEMCFSPEIVPDIAEAGYRWFIVSGIACPAAWPVNRIYQVEHPGKNLAVFFRDDLLSNQISFRQIGPADFLAHLSQVGGNGQDAYVITAMDAETYGHHIQDWERLFLAPVYEQLRPTAETYSEIKQVTALAAQESTLFADSGFTERVKAVTVSDLLDIFPPGEVVSPKPSSWSTSAEDLAAGNLYPLWQDPGNEIHRLQWEHITQCIEVVGQALECADNDESRSFSQIARGLLDLAEHSCQFWWASRRPMWDINLIHLGLIDQMRVMVNAYRAINKSGADAQVKTDYYYKMVAARDIRNKIVDRLFIL